LDVKKEKKKFYLVVIGASRMQGIIKSINNKAKKVKDRRA
jgi:hypothetical protein